MQDEVAKHAKKIYHVLKKTNNSFNEKAKDIIIEILIIVFAVTLSIWLHNWSLYRHQQKEVNIFLTNLKQDLLKDIESLNIGKTQYIESTDEYSKLLIFKPSQFDSLEHLNSKVPFHVNLQGKQINDGNYESFKSSGKLAFLENEQLKQLLLVYYQKNLPAIITIDNYYSQFLFRVIDLKIDFAGKTEREIYSDPRMKEAIHYLILIGKSNIRNYENLGLTQARQILLEIDKELKN